MKSSNRSYYWTAIGIFLLFGMIDILGGSILLWGSLTWGSLIPNTSLLQENILRSLIAGFILLTTVYLLLKRYKISYWAGILTISVLSINEFFKIFSPFSDKMLLVAEFTLFIIAGYSIIKIRKILTN